MRYPLDSITITGAYKEVAQPGTGLPDASGVRRHIGVDLRASVGTKVYAVGSGTVTMSYSGTAGQTIEILIGDKLWRFMHLNKRHVSVGQKVTEGQHIADSGDSGGVLAHLHVDARRNGTTYNASLNNYFDPLALIRDSQTNKGGNQVFNNREEVGEAYLLLRGVRGTAAEENAWVGLPKQRFFQVGKAEADSVRKALSDTQKQLAEVKTALANEQAKPPKEIVKVVEKIVEKPVEVIKEIPVEVIKEIPAEADEQAVVTNWLKRLWNSLFKKG